MCVCKRANTHKNPKKNKETLEKRVYVPPCERAVNMTRASHETQANDTAQLSVHDVCLPAPPWGLVGKSERSFATMYSMADVQRMPFSRSRALSYSRLSYSVEQNSAAGTAGGLPIQTLFTSLSSLSALFRYARTHTPHPPHTRVYVGDVGGCCVRACGVRARACVSVCERVHTPNCLGQV